MSFTTLIGCIACIHNIIKNWQLLIGSETDKDKDDTENVKTGLDKQIPVKHEDHFH